MKNKETLITCILVALLVAMAFTAGLMVCRAGTAGHTEVAAAADDPTYEVSPRTMTVTGQGELVTKPDCATFTVTSEFTEPTSEAARTRTSAMINTAVRTLTALGIEEADIETGYISLYPSQRWDAERQEYVLLGQTAQQSVTVTSHDIASVGDYYEALSVLDGISVSSVTLDKSDKTMEYEQSRTLAVNDAISKAQTYASAAKMELGHPVTISTSGYGATPIYRAANMLMASADAAAEGGVSTEYYAGDITVSSSVTVTFELLVPEE